MSTIYSFGDRFQTHQRARTLVSDAAAVPDLKITQLDCNIMGQFNWGKRSTRASYRLGVKPGK